MDNKSCDVVVIGSGIGGLCLAARLSHRGYKTVVLERMSFLGGRFTCTDHKGYWVPTGANGIMYGERDPIMQTMREVGADLSFEMKSVPHPKWRIGGKDVLMPEKGMFWHLISLLSRDKQEADRVIKAVKRALRWQTPSDRITFAEWLLNITDNRAIYDMFEAMGIGITGPNLHEIAAGEMLRRLRTFTGPMLVPQNGVKDVVDSLARVIRDHGGEILTSTEVTRIAVQDGAATGVEAKGRKGAFQIEARVVANNSGPAAAVRMAGEQHFDRGYIRQMKDLRPCPGIVYCLTTKEPLCDWPGGLYTWHTRRPIVWLDLTAIWPHFAPRGKYLTQCYTAPTSMTVYDERGAYGVFMSDVVELFPRFRDQGGEVLLAHHYCGEWPAVRAYPGHEVSYRSPVENLYNVGDAVKVGDETTMWLGGSGAAESARIVAQDIMARIKI